MNIADGLAELARTRPWGVAVIDAGRITHYGTLDRAVWRAAAAFRRHRIRPGDVVGITLAMPFSHLVAALGLARMGAVQTILSPAETLEERRSIVRRTGAVAVVGDGAKAAELGLRVLEPDPAWLRADGTAIDPGVRDTGGARPWSIVTSSGTTGEPKLIPFSHEKECWRRERVTPWLDLPPGGRLMSFIGMNFSAGKRFQIGCLCAGRTIVFPPKGFPPDARAAFELIERHHVEALVGTPLHLQQLLDQCPADAPRLPGLRRIWTGSAVVTERLRAAVRQRLSPNLVVGYSTNEVGQITVADAAMQARHPGTIGVPVAGLEAQVVDEADRPLPQGEVGRIRVRGPGMEVAYLGDAEATARTCRDGWYWPGDVAAMTGDGQLIFHGRADDLMNCDGIKVYPSEIEAVLLRHPAVAEAVSFPVASERLHQVPAAAVVLRAPATEADLLTFCREHLGYRQPRRILVLDALPRNAMGKVQKRLLAGLAAEAAGEPSRRDRA